MSDVIMDSSFTFTQEDVLCISLSLNALYFLQLVTSKLVHCLLPVLATKGSRLKTLHGLHQRWPDLLGRLLMEHLSLLVLLVLVLVNLGHESSVVPPFGHHRYDDKNNVDIINNNKNITIGEYHLLTRVILSASIARFLLIAAGILHHSPKDSMQIPISSTNTRNAHVDLLYCLVSIASNILGLGYRENLLLLVSAPFMELNTISLIICRLIKLADRHRSSRSYLKTSVLSCSTFIFSRVVLPVLFLCHALAQESPFVMGVVPLVWFVASGIFYTVFHSVLLFYCVRRIIKASGFLTDRSAHTPSSVHEPISTCNYSERLINDIFNDCEDNVQGFNVAKTQSCDNDDLQFKCKPTTRLRDLNYGFLAPYDNRNLCSFVSGVEEEKMNFLQKKNISKNELIYRFLIKADINGTSECCCSQDGCSSSTDNSVKEDDQVDIKPPNYDDV